MNFLSNTIIIIFSPFRHFLLRAFQIESGIYASFSPFYPHVFFKFPKNSIMRKALKIFQVKITKRSSKNNCDLEHFWRASSKKRRNSPLHNFHKVIILKYSAIEGDEVMNHRLPREKHGDAPHHNQNMFMMNKQDPLRFCCKPLSQTIALLTLNGAPKKWCCWENNKEITNPICEKEQQSNRQTWNFMEIQRLFFMFLSIIKVWW